MKACTESVEIEVHLMNGKKVALDINLLIEQMRWRSVIVNVL